MPLYRLRVDLPDDPGALAALAAALAEHGVNILSLTVHGKDAGAVTDDLVVDLRDPAGLGPLICTLHDISADVSISRTEAHVLVDAPARALDLAAWLVRHPGRLGQALARLLGAEQTAEITGSTLRGEPPPYRLSVGTPGSGRLSVWRRWAPFTVTEHAQARALARLAGELAARADEVPEARRQAGRPDQPWARRDEGHGPGGQARPAG